MFFFFKQKTAYEVRISDWSSDVCSSDLLGDYDAAIRRIDATPRGLRAERFLDGGSVPVCSPQYQRHNEVFAPQDLARATLLVSRSENNAWPEWMRTNGIQRAPDVAAKVFDQLSFALVASLAFLCVAPAPISRKAVVVGRSG